jgi:hypothetical protein
VHNVIEMSQTGFANHYIVHEFRHLDCRSLAQLFKFALFCAIDDIVEPGFHFALEPESKSIFRLICQYK